MQHRQHDARPVALEAPDTVEASPLLHRGSVDEAAPAARSLSAGITRACLASAAIVCIAPLQYGYHIAELNTPKMIITACDKDGARWGSLPRCLPMNDAMFSVATSMFAVGGLFGSLAAGWMAERWGRRGALVYNNLPFVVGPLLMAFAASPAMLIVGRFVSGLGSGIAVVIAPLYLSEIAPVKYRGTLNLLNQLSIVVGILVTLTVGMLANSGPYWRISVGFGLLLACAHLLLAAFAVESPRFLWSRNKHAEARAVLRKLRCTADVDDEVATWGATAAGPPAASSGRHCQPYAQAEPAADAAEGSSTPEVDPLQRTQTSSNGSMKPTGPVESEELRGEVASVTIFNIFRIRHYRQPWLLVLALQFGQQLSGINTVFYFSSSVLEKMFSRQVSGILTMMIGVLNVLATAAAAPVVDRFGRRPLLLSSMAAMAISVTLLGVGLGLRLNLLAAVSLYLVVASFAPGYGPVPFLLGTELFDMRAASAGGSWALAANWTGTFLVAAAFLPLLNLIGEWVFAIFVAAILICWVVFYVFVPETKGRTIDEIAMGFK